MGNYGRRMAAKAEAEANQARLQRRLLYVVQIVGFALVLYVLAGALAK